METSLSPTAADRLPIVAFNIQDSVGVVRLYYSLTDTFSPISHLLIRNGNYRLLRSPCKMVSLSYLSSAPSNTNIIQYRPHTDANTVIVTGAFDSVCPLDRKRLCIVAYYHLPTVVRFTTSDENRDWVRRYRQDTLGAQDTVQVYCGWQLDNNCSAAYGIRLSRQPQQRILRTYPSYCSCSFP